MVKANTRCLTWDGDTNRNNGESHVAIRSLYPELQGVRVLNAPRGLALAGLPSSLRQLEVHFKERNKKQLSDLHVSAALSPLSALALLEEAILPGFPDTSLAALECCTALRSLKNESWPFLTDISAFSACRRPHSLASLSQSAFPEPV
eukprot:gene24644-biopygen19102